MTKYSPNSLSTLVSAGERAARIGRDLGNVLVPRGSRRAAALGSAARAARKLVFGESNKRKRSGAGGGAGRPKKRRKVIRRRKVRVQYQGKIGPRFPGYLTNKKVNLMQRSGYVIEYETGGSVSDANAVYLAHGLPTRIVLEAMCGAITRKAMMKFGLEMKGWEIGAMTGSANDRFLWNLQYQLGPSSGTTNGNAAVVLGNQTFINLMVALANLFMASVANGARFQEFIEVRLLWTNRPAATDDFREEFRVMLSDLDVYLMCKSVMTLQNRTEAVKSEVSEVDQTNILDVAHNPLVGKMYSGRTTQINMKSLDSAIDNNFLTLSALSGFDSVAASGALTTAGARKLPYWNDFTHMRGSTNLTLKAGEIRDSVIYYEKKFRAATILQKLLDYMSTSTTSSTGSDSTNLYWPCKMIGLEKKLDSRTAGQPDVVVAFQLNYTLGARCVISKRNAPLRVISI